RLDPQGCGERRRPVQRWRTGKLDVLGAVEGRARSEHSRGEFQGADRVRGRLAGPTVVAVLIQVEAGDDVLRHLRKRGDGVFFPDIHRFLEGRLAGFPTRLAARPTVAQL